MGFYSKAEEVKNKVQWVEADIRCLADMFKKLGPLDRRWLKKTLGKKKYKLVEVLVALDESISTDQEFIVYEDSQQKVVNIGKGLYHSEKGPYFRISCNTK